MPSFADPPRHEPSNKVKYVGLAIIGVAIIMALVLVVALAWNDTVKNESYSEFVKDMDRPYISCLTRRFESCVSTGSSPKECWVTHKYLCGLRHPETTLISTPEMCYGPAPITKEEP